MHKIRLVGTAIMLLLAFSLVCFAETIVLKSGKTFEGKIIEKTDQDIKIDFQGVPLTYYCDEIESIDGEKIDLLGEKNPPLESPLAKTEKEPNNMTGQEANLTTKLPFSTAIIEYVYKGDKKGEARVYIDVKNNKIAEEYHAIWTVQGHLIDINKITIYDGEVLNVFYPNKKEGTGTEIKRDIISTIFFEFNFLNYPVKQANFLDKECNVYETPNGKFYFWNGIRLKEEIKACMKLPGGIAYCENSTRETTKIYLDVSIPSDKFKVPDGIKFMDFSG